MIVKLDKDDWYKLIPILKENILENYFNILGLISEEEVYEDIYVQYDMMSILKSVLLLRKSGTIKFYAKEGFLAKEVGDFLQTIDYKVFIGPLSYCDLIRNENILTKSKKMTELCHLNLNLEVQTNYKNEIVLLELHDLDKVIELYTKSFNSFASKEVLKQRIQTNRGRIYGIFKNKILVSVAGTDFETLEEALIVGVATSPEYRNKGYGTELVKYLSIELQKEGKNVYLEYESLVAGNIYKQLGFYTVDSVYKFWN